MDDKNPLNKFSQEDLKNALDAIMGATNPSSMDGATHGKFNDVKDKSRPL